MADYVGLVASVLLSISVVPQVVKSWRTKQVEDISLMMILLFLLGFAMWVAYGLLVKETPIVLLNAVSLVSMAATLALKLRYS
jgi:MtN3 and saliva related transmembrane protein